MPLATFAKWTTRETKPLSISPQGQFPAVTISFNLAQAEPSAGASAIACVMLFGFDFSMVAMIGVILLIAIVKKNGIMMVDFAITAERERHLSATEAVRRAALLRFRPIMMTTAAALLGGVPLMVGRHRRGDSPAFGLRRKRFRIGMPPNKGRPGGVRSWRLTAPRPQSHISQLSRDLRQSCTHRLHLPPREFA
jgi:multidrug efflux pump subunit AcrB